MCVILSLLCLKVNNPSNGAAVVNNFSLVNTRLRLYTSGIRTDFLKWRTCFMKILNFGSLNIDKVYAVKNFVQPGETILSLDFHTFCGGKGLNQSVAAARAGAAVYHAGAIGADGQMLTDMLESSGVHTDYLQRLDGASGHAIIEVNENGQNRIIVCAGTNGQITEEYADDVLSHFDADDILLLQNEISSIPYIMEQAHKKGMRIAMNPSPVNDALLSYPLQLADWLLVNETEGQLLSGLSSDDEEEILDALHRKYPNSTVIMTLGSKGAWYSSPSSRHFQPSYRVNAVDTTAAGDTFTGYLLCGLSAGKTSAQALEIATRASAIAVSREGAAPSIPCAKEVEEFPLPLSVEDIVVK